MGIERLSGDAGRCAFSGGEGDGERLWSGGVDVSGVGFGNDILSI